MHAVAVVLALAACSTPGQTSGDAALPDAAVDAAAPSRFGRCSAAVTRAEMANGRLIDAAAAGALIASPALALWPADGGAPVALPGVPETAVLSGAALYWAGTDVVVERLLAGGQRELAITAPSKIVRAPDGGVYVVSGQAIVRAMPGNAPLLVTTGAAAITELAASAGVLVWQEGAAIRRRVLGTGSEGTVLADPTARLIGLRGDTAVVARGTTSLALESYDLTGASTGMLVWAEGPVVATVLGTDEVYVSLDRRETMIERQWCSIQPTLYALAWPTGAPAPLVTEPERVIAAPDQIYVQTAGEHGQTCCSGHGMFSCNEQSLEPQAVWCFVR